MSVSAFLSSLRGAGQQQLSASTIAATQETYSHLLQIKGYARISKMLATGEPLRSSTFTAGGHQWRIKCYPNGCRKEHEGSISLFLEHASHAKTGDTTAKIGLSILRDETTKPAWSRNLAECRFTGNNPSWGSRDFIRHMSFKFDKEKYLKDDCLTVLCNVTVFGPRTDDHVELAAAAAAAPPFDLRGQLAEAIWNKQQVDVTIEVGGETFPAHRWMLEARSPVFKEDLSTAAGTAELRIKDMSAEVFKALLQFIYTDAPPEPELLDTATMAERLLVAADRYELQKLKLVCEEALCRRIDMGSVAATLAFAERHRCSVLWGACMQFLSSPGNSEAFMAVDGIEQLKTGCPSALLELLVNKIPN